MLHVKNNRFTIPKAALAIWLIVVALLAVPVLRSGTVDAFGLGKMVGTATGLLIFGAFFAWLAWRITRRRSWVKNSTFVLTVTLLGAAQFADIQSLQAFQAIRDANDQIRRDLSIEFEQDGTIRQKTNSTERLIQAFDRLTHRSFGSRKAVAEASKVFLEKMQKASSYYTQRIDGFDANAILLPSAITNRTQIDPHRRAVQSFLVANTLFKQTLLGSSTVFREEMQTRSIPDRIVISTMRGFQQSGAQRSALIVNIRDQDDEMGRILLELLDLYEQEWGSWHWRAEDEAVVFKNENARETYVALMERILTLTCEQQQTMADLVHLQ
jgi:hypothetical protein